MRPSSENVSRLNGSPTLSTARGLRDGLELLRLQLRDRRFDRGLALRSVEPFTFGRGEDEIQHGSLLGRELGFDQIRRPLRVGTRDLELVLQAAADRGDEDDEKGEDSQPAEDDAPGVRRARSHPAGERAGGQALVRG